MIKNVDSGIKIENLTKMFGNVGALKNVSMNFPSNKVVGLIGFNGSGKTTTFNVLTNFIETYDGVVNVNGTSTRDINITRKISYLAAGAEPKNTMKVKSHLATMGRINGLSAKECKSKILELSRLVELDDVLNWQIKKLSKGNQQKIKIISSLLNKDAKFYLLDEPFDGLDPIMVKKVMAIYLALKDVSIIITSHRMDVVNEMVSQFYVLKDGKLIKQSQGNETEVEINVNLEVPITAIKKMSCVISAEKGEKVTKIVIKSIKDFKKVNKKLIASPKYVFSTIKDKNLAQEVFEGYGV